jgi:hypothetical protein
MSVRKTFDVTQFGSDNITVLRRVLDQMSHDALTFKFTDTIPTVDTVDYHEVVLYDNGNGSMRMCVKTGKGNLFCTNIYPGLMPQGPVTNVTSGPYTVTDNDYVILVDATTAAITVNLPTAVGRLGRIFNIKRINTNANSVIIDAAGAEVIDNTATKTLVLPYTAVTLYSDNVKWWII